MPVAPITATRGCRGGVDDIAIHRFVCCSMDLKEVSEVAALLDHILRPEDLERAELGALVNNICREQEVTVASIVS